MSNIKILKQFDPYPKDVFTEPSDEEIRKAVKALNDAGLCETKMFAHMARVGYNCALRMLESQQGNMDNNE